MNRYLNRKEAFDRAVKEFGPWRTWTRAQHLAYGLIRNTPYSLMESSANDIPPINRVLLCLWQLGAWDPVVAKSTWWRKLLGRLRGRTLVAMFPTPGSPEAKTRKAEVESMIRWVKKRPRKEKNGVLEIKLDISLPDDWKISKVSVRPTSAIALLHFSRGSAKASARFDTGKLHIIDAVPNSTDIEVPIPVEVPREALLWVADKIAAAILAKSPFHATAGQ